MANTWVVTSLTSDERLEQFRSVDFDPAGLYERHGAVMVYDLTDGLRLVGDVTNQQGYVTFERPEWLR